VELRILKYLFLLPVLRTGGKLMKDPLFEPIRINGMEVKNRICMPAIHMNMCRNFEVTDPLIEFYAERARAGRHV
jgi:2,4-dienoyl-CoA reductase-like NADH-dependent reductase (Old Yellow Enzyme family)